ncbi:MAG: GNAT family N-acetyltransferase [Eggerthellaceae bacterium]|nr:GNAT family N-acetyltransferase [Eggerthellaceae bacterium]
MERCYLERPSVARKDDIREYLNEIVEAGQHIHGTGGLDRIFKGWTFEDALARCLGMENPEYAAKTNWCPGRTFFLVRERDRRIIGSINVRWSLTEQARQFAGHIGYGIRPSEQRQGYAKLMLYLGLKEALKAGEREIIVGCDTANVASAKTILALGGVWERSESGEDADETDDFYTIDVPAALAKFAPVYEPFVGLPLERIYLERPSLARKDDILAFMGEIVAAGQEFHGIGGLDKALGDVPFEEALEHCRRLETEGIAADDWHLKSRTLFMVRERDGRIIGNLAVRWDLSETARRHIGHVGCGLRPDQQHQGYGKLGLYLGLRELQKMGEPEAIVGCATTNIASAKTIRALGGVWVWRELWEAHNEWDDYYRIGVDEALAKFADRYERFVAEQSVGERFVAPSPEVSPAETSETSGPARE